MVKNKFTITITDINGSRHFYLSQVIKKIALYIIAFILFFLICSVLYIKYLDSQVGELNEKKEELLKKSKELELTNAAMQQSVDEKAQQYAAIEDKIAAFEEALGVDGENNLSINARLENLNITNEQQVGILNQVPNGWPIENQGITSNFGWRENPINNRREYHPGIDLRAPIGTPIYATANGVVEFAGYINNGYGYNVIILHNFGFKTVFAHMMRKDVVRAGQFVQKGQLIGYTGNTGYSTGPHLHYEVRFINKTLEPIYFIKLERKNMNEFFNQERRVSWQSLIKAMAAAHQAQPTKPQ